MKDKLLKKTLIKLFFPYGSIRTIFAGPCRGMKVLLSPSSGHAILRGYEKKQQGFLKNKIKKNMTVYDIGASCGQSTLFFARLVGSAGHVVAFEPVDSVFKEWRVNMDLNRLSWTIGQPYLLTNRDGIESFLFNEDYPTMGKVLGMEGPIFKIAQTRGISVTARKLDSLSENFPPPDVLKIDVEGSAGLVLEGAKQTLRRYSPSIFIELHGPEENKAVLSVLRELEYEIKDLKGLTIPDISNTRVLSVWCSKRQ